MVKLLGAIANLKPIRVLVAGDLMLDMYTIGKSRRISPEAPVPVVHALSQQERAGGSGNVMLNLLALGAEVTALGRVGNDYAGERLTAALSEMDTCGLIREEGFTTPVKNRIIADNQQMLRIDTETVQPLSEVAEKELIARLPHLLKNVSAVAISDYSKGFLSPNLLHALMTAAKNLPIITDPKGIDYLRYRGSTIVKPNLGEAYAAANLPPETSLKTVAETILSRLPGSSLMVTRSQEGISLFFPDNTQQDFPIRKREVKDVTGAGDTVLAVLTLALGSGLTLPQATQLANVAAGLAVEHLGCAQITLPEITHELLKTDSSNKLFDKDHLFALKHHNYTTLPISTKSGLTKEIFTAIRQTHATSPGGLLLHVTDETPDPHTLDLLTSLSEVDFILLE